MAYETYGEAIAQVAKMCSLTNGQNMTPYSQELFGDFIVLAHETILKEQEWDEMVIWRQRTLDGETGKITELITDTKNWKRIRRIYHYSFQTPLPKLSSYVNPITGAAALMLGYRGMAPEEDNTGEGKYLVQFYPSTLSGSVLFQIERELDWNDQDTILPIDWWLHVFHASWQYLIDDGSNPMQADKFAKMYAKRLKQVQHDENARPILLNPNQIIPNDWFEQDAPYQ